ncbi:MAG: branched-chain amino acid ABC transporter permease [Actinomycetota bacterium]|nr:branched-chain amino acid ABC transporter permease [Actinomycetota bacterium]
MSDTAPPRRGRPQIGPGLLVGLGLVVIVMIMPFYLPTSLLQTGLFAMSAVVGAIGLNLLTGTAGQLSLAHGFFLAIGAYGYVYFAGTSSGPGLAKVSGLGLPPIIALVLAVVLAGFAGLLFSPISSRLGGIYLGVASLSLVFIGQHILFNASSVTGGFSGRNVPPLNVLGFSFADSHPDLFVLGVPFGQYERLWYFALAISVGSYIFARNVLRSRPGRALQTVRDSAVAAGVLGVNVRRYKAAAFVLSSMYAGLAGVIYAVTFSHIVPDAFGLTLSIDFLAMIIIGGLGSVGGAALGAVFVIGLPNILLQYSSVVPFLAEPGSGGLDAGRFARFVYGALIVLTIMFQPAGLAGLGRRLRRRRPGDGPAPPGDARTAQLPSSEHAT